MPHVFRPSQKYRRWSIVAIVFLLAIATAGAWLFWTEGIPEWRLVAAIGYGGIFIGFALAGGWDYISVGCSAISINDARLVLTNPLRRDEIDFNELVSARWLVLHPGIELCAADRRLKIYFASYEQSQPWTMIDLLRERIPDARQRDWPLFCHRIALPMRVGNSNRPLRPGEVLLSRRRWDWIFGVSTIVFAIAGFVAWAMVREIRFLVIPAFLLLVWLPMRRTTPKTGLIFEPGRKSPVSVWPWLAIVLASVPTLWLGKAVGSVLGDEVLGLTVSSVPLFMAMIHRAYRVDKQQREFDLQCAPKSVAEWNAMRCTW
jgi:hypothetical protein